MTLGQFLPIAVFFSAVAEAGGSPALHPPVEARVSAGSTTDSANDNQEVPFSGSPQRK